MYSCEATCKNCGHMTLYTEKELWSIVSVANDLEMELMNEGESCNICGQLCPLHLLVKNEDTSLVVFEKNISNTPNISKYGKSPIENIQDISDDLNKPFYPPNSNHTNYPYHKPTMDNPCIVCCATGKLEIQYRAHKKEGDFKGVLVEECPICDGKGYFK